VVEEEVTMRWEPGQVPYTMRLWVLPLNGSIDAASLGQAAQTLIGRMLAVLQPPACKQCLAVEWQVAGPDPVAVELVRAALKNQKTPQTLRGPDLEDPVLSEHRNDEALDWCEVAIRFAPAASDHQDRTVLNLLRRDRRLLGVDPDSKSSDPYRLVLPQQEPHDYAEEVSAEELGFPVTAKELSPGYHQLSKYSEDCKRKISAQEEKEIADAKQTLRKAGKKLSPETMDKICQEIIPHFARADALAKHYQKQYLWVSQALFWLGASALTIVIGQTLFFPEQTWVLLFEIIALTAAVVLYWWSHRQDWHEKWLNDRFLAEQLRYLQFAAALGRPNPPDWEPHRFLSFYKGPETWLVDVPRRLAAEIAGRISEPEHVKDAQRFLLDGWITGQISYHQNNARKRRGQEKWFHLFGLVLFGLTVTAAALHVMGAGHAYSAAHLGRDGHGPVAPPWTWSNLFIFAAVALPACGSALQAILNQLELRRVAARSERMERLLLVASSRVEDADSLQALRWAAAEAWRVMGSEAYEWWVLLGFRDPTLPA
jgi:hypothetical protein